MRYGSWYVKWNAIPWKELLTWVLEYFLPCNFVNRVVHSHLNDLNRETCDFKVWALVPVLLIKVRLSTEIVTINNFQIHCQYSIKFDSLILMRAKRTIINVNIFFFKSCGQRGLTIFYIINTTKASYNFFRRVTWTILMMRKRPATMTRETTRANGSPGVNIPPLLLLLPLLLPL